MSKQRPLSGLDVTEKLLAQAEARRLASLSEAELREEMLDAGLDPDRPIDIEKWMTPVKAPAGPGAAPDDDAKPAGHAEGSDDDAKPAGHAEGSAANAGSAGDLKPAPVAVLPVRRRSPVALWTSITAVAACVLGLVVARGALEHAHGGDVQVAHADAAPPPTATASGSVLVRAAQLRDEAQRACDEELWGACAQRLDDAKALDPVGEHESRVQVMRHAIEQGMWLREHPAPQSTLPFDSKPGPPRPKP